MASLGPAARQALIAAARAFNAGRYFEAHEALEDNLDEVPDELWDLFLGLIQISVGYHKATNHHPGSAKMLRLGLEKIADYPVDNADLNLDALRKRVQSDLEGAQDGIVHIAATDPPRLQPLPPKVFSDEPSP